MKFVRLVLLASMVLLAPAGCSITRTLPPQPDPLEIPAAIPSADELQGRLNAANAISSINLRDQTLAALALESVNASRPELTKQALMGISSMNLRDTVAADCAVRLGRGGRSDLGLELAGLIGSSNLRDQTLSRLATGK